LQVSASRASRTLPRLGWYRDDNEIAQTLQFCDEFHLTKLFKKEYGIPPSKYRTTVQ
jgi:YesN/AraC family two-component response regulator